MPLNFLDRFGRSRKNNDPILINNDNKIYYKDFQKLNTDHLKGVQSGDVVILIGDYDQQSILNFLYLLDLKAIIVPLIKNNLTDLNYNIETTSANFVVEGKKTESVSNKRSVHILISELRKRNNAGIIFFSTGTTGKPKAILHDTELLFKRFETPRPSLKSINFLLFDHMGGINTMLHSLYNGGTIVNPKNRNPKYILETIKRYDIELLPATPTFLRMLLMSGMIPKKIPKCLKIITYGSEKMDQQTLNVLCDLLPEVDFRQTYGLSEFCVLRAKSKSRNSLFVKVGGEGIEIRIVNNILLLKSKYRMMGYLNADSPFDNNGWYNTKDIVEEENGFLKFVGRDTEVVNVGGLKFMTSEVEDIAMKNEDVANVSVYSKSNPITGQHVEVLIETIENKKINLKNMKEFFKENLPVHMRPQRIIFGKVNINHRFKKIN